MSERSKKIGILGGTFDPIHTGHLILAEEAFCQLDLDKVWIMPNGNPPHKQRRTGGASDFDRTEMVRLAISGNDHFELSLEEMNRREMHYSYHTLEDLKKRFPDTAFYFIIGADSLFTFESWMKPERICRTCVLAAAVRDHATKDEMEKQAGLLREKYGAEIVLMENPNIDISSSWVRSRAARNRSIRYYVPDAVRNYILERNIYSGGSL